MITPMKNGNKFTRISPIAASSTTDNLHIDKQPALYYIPQ